MACVFPLLRPGHMSYSTPYNLHNLKNYICGPNHFCTLRQNTYPFYSTHTHTHTRRRRLDSVD